jgi:hypothetical protein
MLGKVEFLIDDRLAFDQEVIVRVEGVHEHIRWLVRVPGLFEPVREPLDIACFKKMVQAVDDLPFEITHWLVVGCGIKKRDLKFTCSWERIFQTTGLPRYASPAPIRNRGVLRFSVVLVREIPV